MNKNQVKSLALNTVDFAIKNSEVLQPYVKPKHYRYGLMALNALYFALRKF